MSCSTSSVSILFSVRGGGGVGFLHHGRHADGGDICVVCENEDQLELQAEMKTSEMLDCPSTHCSWKKAWLPDPHNFTNSFKDASTNASSVKASNLGLNIVVSEDS